MSVEGFAAVPNWMLRDESISGRALAVYTALASHTGPGGIHPSQPTIARESRLSESSVRRALVELESLGVVVRVRRKSELGRATNGYVLNPHGRLGADEVAVSVTATPLVTVTGTGGSGQGVNSIPLIEEEPIKKMGRPSVADVIDETDIPKGSMMLVPLPKPFLVIPEMRAWATRETPSVNVDAVSLDFVAYWREGQGKGKRKKNWVLAWRNWLKANHKRNVEHGWKPASEDDRKVIRGGRVVA